MVSADKPNTLTKKTAKVTILGQKYPVRELIVGLALLIPTIGFLIFTFIRPVIDVVDLSFTNFNMSTGIGVRNGVDNYKYLMESEDFWKSIGLTFIYAFLKLTLDTALALFLAVLLDKNIPCKKFLRSTFFAPVVVPMVASSLIWIWFYDPDVGPFDQILTALGFSKIYWLTDEKTALISILLFSLWKGVGYNMVLFLSGLQNISDSYTEAASLDGATNWQMFWKIKFPLLRPITSFVLMMGLINSFKVFAEINVMTPDYALGATKLIVCFIYEQAFTYGRMGRASAASLILFFLVFLLTMIQSRLDSSKTIDLE